MKITRRKFGILAGSAVLVATIAGQAHAETTLERIKRTKKLTVGTETSYRPFEYIENGKIVGYGPDILKEVVKALDVELVQLDVPWQGILPGVLAGKFDFVATAVGVNEERAKRYAFTLPIADATPHFGKRKGDPMTTVQDLNGKVVGTLLAGSTEPVARALNDQLKAAGGEGFELKLYTAFTDTHVALANGEIDACIEPLPTLALLVKERADVFELGAPVEAGTKFAYTAWVTRPEDTDLRDFISGVIKRMKEDGSLAALQEKWFGFRMELPDSGFLPPGAI